MPKWKKTKQENYCGERWCVECEILSTPNFPCKHYVSMFEGNPPCPPYLEQLISIVVFYPVKSAALMPWQIYSASLGGKRKTKLPAVFSCLWLWWIMCLERDIKTEGSKSLFALSGNKTVTVCSGVFVSGSLNFCFFVVVFKYIQCPQHMPLHTCRFILKK